MRNPIVKVGQIWRSKTANRWLEIRAHDERLDIYTILIKTEKVTVPFTISRQGLINNYNLDSTGEYPNEKWWQK